MRGVWRGRGEMPASGGILECGGLPLLFFGPACWAVMGCDSRDYFCQSAKVPSSRRPSASLRLVQSRNPCAGSKRPAKTEQERARQWACGLPHSKVRSPSGEGFPPYAKRKLESIMPPCDLSSSEDVPIRPACFALSGQEAVGTLTQGAAALWPGLSYLESRWDSGDTVRSTVFVGAPNMPPSASSSPPWYTPGKKWRDRHVGVF